MKDMDGRVYVGEVGGNIEILKFDQHIFKYKEKKKEKTSFYSTCLHRKKENLAERGGSELRPLVLKQFAWSELPAGQIFFQDTPSKTLAIPGL